MDSEPRFRFREGTIEEWIYKCVVTDNEYGLPERFLPDDVVIDVGMHIGSFCHAAALRGAGRVYGFEADESNFRRAAEHLAPYGDRVRPAHNAVWRSDEPPTTLRLFRARDGENTGGGNVVWSEGDASVPALPFDDIVRHATRGGLRVRFLKIDCEGSEFPILFTSKSLHLIDEVAGEYHEFGGEFDDYPLPAAARVPGYTRYTIVELTEVLEASGFAVTSSRFGESNIGLFRAVRPGTAARVNALASLAGRIYRSVVARLRAG
jgi:FkbM family methyltransferase